MVLVEMVLDKVVVEMVLDKVVVEMVVTRWSLSCGSHCDSPRLNVETEAAAAV